MTKELKFLLTIRCEVDGELTDTELREGIMEGIQSVIPGVMMDSEDHCVFINETEIEPAEGK